MLAARASYLVGFAGTATVEAERLFGIPTFGTMAHSFIEAHDDEATAFEHFAEARPEGLTLLLDTYDTEAAARKVVALAPRLREAGITIRSVRLDSGDLAGLAKSVRRILDRGRAPAGAPSSPAAGSTNTRSPRWSPPRRRSTASASAPASPPRPTCRRSTASTSSRTMPGCRARSSRPASPPGRGGSRSGAAMAPTEGSPATSSRPPTTSSPARR